MADNKFLTYNALDSACTLEARNEFWHELDNGYWPAYDMTMRLYPVLTFMQTRGIKVDIEKLGETQREIRATQAEKQEELNRIVGRELNALSPKQVGAYFYIEKGVPPYTNKEGQVTTDDLALQRLAKPTAKRQGFREAKLIQDIRGLNKLASSYLEVQYDPDHRIRCSWNPRGTKFGRLSSSATVFGTGMNLQNLHPQFKKFLGADQDYFLVEVDKRQAEWVLVAYLTQDANMLKVIESGMDPHVFTGSMIFGVPEDIVKLDEEVVGSETDRNVALDLRMANPTLAALINRLPTTFSARQVGKHANHGLNYDEGPVTFALYWELEQSFAKFVVNRYHQVYPGIRVWYKSIQHQLSKDRTLINCFGRKMRFMEQWGDELFKSAYSALPQSTQVDGLNTGLCDIYADDEIVSKQGGNGDILAQVHDSNLLQFPKQVLLNGTQFYDIMKKVYAHLSPTMEYHGRSFKIETDMKAGLNWGAYHRETNQEGMQKVTLGSDPEKFVRTMRGLVGVEQS